MPTEREERIDGCGNHPARAYDQSDFPGSDRHKKQAILINGEQHYLLSELAGMLPDSPHYKTVHNWCKIGVDIAGQPIVKMEYIISSRGWRSSVEAYYRFLKRLNDFPEE